MHIEQLLHGYHNGHHLIAGSVSLPIKDADIMSYLSDWTDYINPISNDTSYITAYPLKESNYYVIAKSWYAHEMSRPGCVWTHSLLVDLSKLGIVDDLCALAPLFRRPNEEGDDFIAYTKSIDLPSNLPPHESIHLDGFDETRMLLMLAGLMERKKPLSYHIEKDSDFYIDLCLRIIQNTPIGILSDLSLCSGTASVRKLENSPFNLQFVVNKGDSLFEPYTESNIKPTADKGFKFWMNCMLSGRKDVSMLVRRFSPDLGNASEKFISMVNLLRLLNEKISLNNTSIGIDDVIFYLTKEFDNKESGANLKREFLSESVSSIFCNEKTFILTLSSIKEYASLDYNAFDFSSRVISFKVKNGEKAYMEMLSELAKKDSLNEEGIMLLSSAFDGFSTEQMINFANNHWNLLKSIVNRAPQILSNDFWIDLPNSQFLFLFSVFQNTHHENFSNWNKLYEKLLIKDTFVSDVICSDFKEHVSEYIQIALNKWNHDQPLSFNRTILNLCFNDKNAVLNWMGGQITICNFLREKIKSTIRPNEDLVIQSSSTIWKAFVCSELSCQRDANNLIFVYELAFSWNDWDSLQYLKAVLPHIYNALLNDKLSSYSWQIIEKYTGEVPFWISWDKCRRLLLGVRNHCINMNLKISEVSHFTSDEKLNKVLLDLWDKKW